MFKRIGARVVLLLTLSVAPAALTPDADSVAGVPQPQAGAVKLFFILLDGNGRFGKKVGCNDSVVSVVKTVEPTAAPLQAALTELLSVKDETYCETGLYNPLHQSSLKLESVSVGKQTAVVKMVGEYRDGGHCDTPRAEAQLTETVKQFTSVKKVRFFVNGRELTFDPTD
jgi:hypothetical protein